MTNTIVPPDSSSTSSPGDPTRAPEALERIETARLMNRQRRTWRILLILLVSAGLLMLAAVLRRDQVRRQSAVKELQVLASAFDRWVHSQASFPPNLETVLGERSLDLDEHFEYADVSRRMLAISRNEIVAIVYAKHPTRLTISQSGRPVMLCRKADFDVKWMTEPEFASQRRLEETLIAKSQDFPRIQPPKP